MVSVNQISIDNKGEYIATCSDDGMVNDSFYLSSMDINKILFQIIISGLYTDENNQKINIGKAVKSIALDPYHYKSGSGRKFIVGKIKT